MGCLIVDDDVDRVRRSIAGRYGLIGGPGGLGGCNVGPVRGADEVDQEPHDRPGSQEDREGLEGQDPPVERGEVREFHADTRVVRTSRASNVGKGLMRGGRPQYFSAMASSYSLERLVRAMA